MSGEIIATLAVGIPASVAAIAAFLLTRSESADKRVRQLVTDLLAPIKERLDDVEQDIEELRRRDHHR